MVSTGFVLRGRFVHGVGAPGELELIEDGCVVVGEDGAISHVAKTTEAVEILLRRTDQRVITLAHTYVPEPLYCTYGLRVRHQPPACCTYRRHKAARP